MDKNYLEKIIHNQSRYAKKKKPDSQIQNKKTFILSSTQPSRLFTLLPMMQFSPKILECSALESSVLTMVMIVCFVLFSNGGRENGSK